MLREVYKDPNTGTRSGFHFYDLYNKCQRKFFINYIKNIESAYTAPPLVLGGAFHLAKEKFYLGKEVSNCILDAVDYIKGHESTFYDSEQFGKVLNRCPIMFESWVEDKGRTILEHNEVFAVEQYIEAPLPGTGYLITMRLDAILKSKAGYYTIEETKSTQSSLDNMKTQVRLGDQATLYTWGFKQAYPDLPLLGVVPDITYWAKNTDNPKLIRNYRGIEDIITRNKDHLKQWEINMNTMIGEITDKVEAFKDGKVSEHAFYRDTYWCNSYYKPCEYATICRANDLDTITSDDFVKAVRNVSNLSEEVV